LTQAGLLDDEQLKKALAEQKRKGVRLGQLLIRDEILSEAQIIGAVSQQLKIPVYSREKYPCDTDLKRFVPEDLARNQQLAPLCKVGEILYVAVLDPTDLLALDMVTDVTRLDVEPVVCTERDLHTLFQIIYGSHLTQQPEMALESLPDVDIEEKNGGDDEVAEGHSDNYLLSLAEDAPVIRLANSILLQAVAKHASDIHILPEKDSVQLRFRIDGDLMDFLAPPKSVFLPLISRLKLLARMDISVSRIPQDGRFSFRTETKEINVRASTLPTIHGEKMVLRLLEQSGKFFTLDELGLQPDEKIKIETAASRPHGMILVTGPTGSGKSTLLYAQLKTLNTPNVNIVTLEDPVEYQLKGLTQVQLNRKAGMTFASGLRSILRQDPDIIMVGEIRDVETATIAIEAALTGHKVLSTLHTNDAPGAITRFVEMGVEPFLISSTLLVVVAQRLVRRLCFNCRETYAPNAEQVAFLQAVTGKGPQQLYRAVGCRDCGPNGYKGRIGVFEALEINEEVRPLILRRASAEEIKMQMVERGQFRTLVNDAASKTLAGVTSFEEFLKVYAA
jgi:type IV pilus assembly protein PilB